MSESYQQSFGSFKDPAGNIFEYKTNIYRSINAVGREDYELLLGSGLFDELTQSSKLVWHHEVESPRIAGAWKIIQPERVETISYPYEWSFSQLKDAALLTLEVQKSALLRGMTLKDASAFNVQFVDNKPLFIDTLSFEGYVEGQPWAAYKQFCEHFLAPLALMSYVDVRLSKLFVSDLGGVPLDLAVELLPLRTKFRPSLYAHLHLHAKYQVKYSDRGLQSKSKAISLSRNRLISLVDSLSLLIQSLKWKPLGTEWGDYYSSTNYSSPAASSKHDIVSTWLYEISPSTVWDLGANDGTYSKIASELGSSVVAFDIDPAAVEAGYLKAKNDPSLPLCLVLDLMNPSPRLGWALAERMSFSDRGGADCVMALALVHHLAISNNVPLGSIAQYFSSLSPNLIVEFVPKSDSQVKKLLSTRKDIFQEYNSDGFERAFEEFYELVSKEQVEDSDRILYRFKSRRK